MASSTDGPPSQEKKGFAQSPSTSLAGSSQPTTPQVPTRPASPVPSRRSGLPELTRIESDRLSTRSHVSVSAIGTLPLGSLHVHRAMDPPRPQQQQLPDALPQADASDMPPLGDDVAVSGGLTAPGTSTRGGVEGGDAFVVLDLPKHSTVGCDAKAIGTGTSEFRGFRDIPPGPHFIWISEPGAMSRSGHWFVTADGEGKGRVRIKQWDKFNEVLVQPASRFEVRDLSENIASLYPQLVPHGYGGGGDDYTTTTTTTTTTAAAVAPRKISQGRPDIEDEDPAQVWRRLTSAIDEKVLSRITGKRGVSEWLVDTSDSAKGEPGFPHTTQTYKTVAGTGELDFLFPEGDVDLGAIGHGRDNPRAAGAGGGGGDGGKGEGADHATPDTTVSILRLLDHPGTRITDSDLLGELQFAFLTGLHLSNLSCVDQWWHLVLKVILRAHDLALVRPGLARAFVQTLHAQMVYNEEYITGNSGGSAAAAAGGGGGGGGGGRNEEGEEEEGFGDEQSHRHEYGGADAQGTSILDIVPGNKRKLREALALYKRRMDEILLNVPGEERITAEQGAVGQAFVDMETWFWQFGWDLRVDARRERSKGRGAGGGGDEHEDGDDEYQPVIVDLDENGREVGLVSFS
ncbi:hypothetical protein VM1G_00392 [Cytospora mali]|uniref:Protein AAR2 n=1 Tax=Cytospora mali TaxID=578113 RepID=A0A194VM52_CYTMA|nr:hypothetical protein VM1G_00392 [Valsa mali]